MQIVVVVVVVVDIMYQELKDSSVLNINHLGQGNKLYNDSIMAKNRSKILSVLTIKRNSFTVPRAYRYSTWDNYTKHSKVN